MDGPVTRPPQPEWQKVLLSKPGKQTLILLAAMLFAFFPLVRLVWGFWFEKDSYYSHGPLIPFLSAYIAYTRRDQLSKIEFKPVLWAAIPLMFLVYVTWIGARTDQAAVMSFAFILAMLCVTLMVGGWTWLKKLALPIGFLIFAMPVWQTMIDSYTEPLQKISTDSAFFILEALGLHPMKADSMNIMLGKYTLFVGVPCSGLKLLLSVTAFMALFTMIANLNWWRNGLLVALILPLCVFINGLRIAMIGIVGNINPEWGPIFHDWSGYISLIVCFLILGRVTRALGWK